MYFIYDIIITNTIHYNNIIIIIIIIMYVCNSNNTCYCVFSAMSLYAECLVPFVNEHCGVKAVDFIGVVLQDLFCTIVCILYVICVNNTNARTPTPTAALFERGFGGAGVPEPSECNNG